jgi:hypothetical protein
MKIGKVSDLGALYKFVSTLSGASLLQVAAKTSFQDSFKRLAGVDDAVHGLSVDSQLTFLLEPVHQGSVKSVEGCVLLSLQ